MNCNSGVTSVFTGQNSFPYSNNYDYGQYWSIWNPFYRQIEVEPKSCVGKAHVFECEHVDACQCGAIQRVMPKAKKGKRR